MAGRGRTPTLPLPTDTMHSMGRSGHSALASSMARYVGLLYTTAPSCHLGVSQGEGLDAKISELGGNFTPRSPRSLGVHTRIPPVGGNTFCPRVSRCLIAFPAKNVTVEFYKACCAGVFPYGRRSLRGLRVGGVGAGERGKG